MLTLKIFVIIMSVTSITIVNVNSSSVPTLSDTPGLRRSRSVNVNSTESSYSSGTAKITKEFVFYNPENHRLYTIDYNPYNPFFRESAVGFECYRQIRLFCDTEINILKSHNCIKKALYYYRRNIMGYIGGNTYSLSYAHDFYGSFQMIAGSISLPSDYCRKDETMGRNYMAHIDPVCMHDLRFYQELVKKPQIVTPDANDTAQVPLLEDTIKNAFEKAKLESRHAIAMFALLHRSILGLDPDSFEKGYLQHISERVKAEEQHEPHAYCRNLQELHNSQTELRLG